MSQRGTMIDPEEDSRYIPFTDEQLKALADMYREGRSARSLSIIYGVSAETVRRRLEAMGVELRGRGGNHVVLPGVLEKAKQMRQEKKSWRAIVKETGVKSDTIMFAMRRERARLASCANS